MKLTRDSIDTTGVPIQRGSPIFRGRTPDIDAESVARMKKAGAILLAKTNLPEFSYLIQSGNLLSGRSNNPWDLTRTRSACAMASPTIPGASTFC